MAALSPRRCTRPRAIHTATHTPSNRVVCAQLGAHGGPLHDGLEAVLCSSEHQVVSPPTPALSRDLRAHQLVLPQRTHPKEDPGARGHRDPAHATLQPTPSTKNTARPALKRHDFPEPPPAHIQTSASHWRRGRGEAKGARASFLTDRRGAEKHRGQGRRRRRGSNGKKLLVAAALLWAEHGRQRTNALVRRRI